MRMCFESEKSVTPRGFTNIIGQRWNGCDGHDIDRKIKTKQQVLSYSGAPPANPHTLRHHPRHIYLSGSYSGATGWVFFATFTGKIHQLENEDDIMKPTHRAVFMLLSVCKSKQKIEMVARQHLQTGHLTIVGHLGGNAKATKRRGSGSTTRIRMISLVKLAYTSAAKSLVSWAH